MNPETMIRTPDAAALRRLIGGTVIGPEDDGYDAERGGFNAHVDQRPALIAVPGNAEEVAAVVRFAAEQRAAGGAAADRPQRRADGGPLDETILLKTLAPGPGRDRRPPRRARVGSGARWDDVVPQASPLGLAALHGSTPDVSVTGYTPRRRPGLVRPQARARRQQRHRDRAGHRRRRDPPRQPPDRAGAVLGAARRRRQLRRRHRDGVRPVPGRRGLRRRPLLPVRAGRGGAAGVAGVDRRRPRRGDLGRAAAAVPAVRGGPGAGPRQIVRASSRRSSSAARPRARSCWRRCGRWGRRWTRSRWCRRRGSPSCTWTRATRCPRPAPRADSAS